jgi:Protein of unknown function (DUF4236)
MERTNHPMGFRFRKRIRLVQGLYLNVGKTGAFFSIGNRERYPEI